MNHNASSLILNNARSLLDSAIILRDNGKLSHAGHFSVSSIEECAKYMMRTKSISQFYSERDFKNHFKKEDAVNFIWVLAGQISVAYMFDCIANSEHGDEEWRKSNKNMSSLLIQQITDLHSDNAEKRLKKVADKIKQLGHEKKYKYDIIRKNTIYTDPDSGRLADILDDDLYECISFARFCTEFIQMIHDGRFCWDSYFEIVPKTIADKMEEEVNVMLKGLEEKKRI